jgi:hypothetical protein
VEMTPAPLAEPSPTEESVPTTEAPATG